jgi:hypothetical protein
MKASAGGTTDRIFFKFFRLVGWLCLSEIARVSPRSAALSARKTFNRSILNTRVTTHDITLIKNHFQILKEKRKLS